jgi:hypothetical protein
MTYSGSGDVTGPVFLAANFGCAAEDYAAFSPPPGGAPVVVLVGRGSCSFREKVLNATAWANASAVVVHNSEGLDGPVSGTLGGVLPQPIPVVGVTYGLAQTLIATQNLPLALSAAPNASQWLVVELRVVSESSIKTSWTANLFAETPDGDDSRVVVQGSHLDSVPAGPGINDNGSGSATNLQIALMFYRAKLKPRNKGKNSPDLCSIIGL